MFAELMVIANLVPVMCTNRSNDHVYSCTVYNILVDCSFFVRYIQIIEMYVKIFVLFIYIISLQFVVLLTSRFMLFSFCVLLCYVLYKYM